MVIFLRIFDIVYAVNYKSIDLVFECIQSHRRTSFPVINIVTFENNFHNNEHLRTHFYFIYFKVKLSHRKPAATICVKWPIN